MAGFHRRQMLALAGGAAVWASLLSRGFRAMAQAALSGATITESIGTVKAKKAPPPPPTVAAGGDPAPPAPKPAPPAPDDVQKGYAIEAGTSITTAAKSAAQIQMLDGALLTVGARSTAIVGQSKASAYLDAGKFHFKTAPGQTEQSLATAVLTLTVKEADFVVSVRDNASVWVGVTAGTITCTSNRKGTAVPVAAGQSVAWTGGSFGKGATKGVFRTEDIAVDQGMDAAHAAWAPPDTPPPPAIAPPAVHPQPTPGSVSGPALPPAGTPPVTTPP